jgi:hypothetical protein
MTLPHHIQPTIEQPSSQKRKNRMNESLTRRISWGAKQTSTAAVVSPNKKHVDTHEEHSSSSDEEGDAQAAKGDASNLADSASKKRRASAFDYVGTGTDAENYEDQFKAAYHDETDMEDAFATDDTKELDMPMEDLSDAPATAGDTRHADPTAPAHTIDDSTETGSTKVETKKPKTSSPAKSSAAAAAAVGPSSTTETATHAEEPSDESESQTGNVAAETPTATPSKVRKEKKHKKKQPKPVKAMATLAEATDEEDEPQAAIGLTNSSSSVGSNTQVQSPAATSPITSPQRKKSVAGGLRGFLKKLGGSRHKSEGGLEASTSNPSIAPAATAGPSASSSPAMVVASPSAADSSAPKSPRSAQTPAKVKVDPYEPMHAELKSYVAMERAYIQDLTLLVEEYLEPAKKSNLDHLAALLAPTENLLESHTSNLKIIEKKMKDDHIPFGSYFDDLLAEVSDPYKHYRSKQVLLLSLLDSSPTEKSMADHAALSNWIQTRSEAHEEQGKLVAPLQELILAPMHRLSNLAFVLERLLEVTPNNHPDSTNIRKATARGHLLHSEVCARGTTYRSMAKLSEIDAMLEYAGGAPTFLLADESYKRSYLLEGPLDHLELNADQFYQFNKVHLFLFNDLALLCKQLAKTADSSRPTSPSKSYSSIAANGNGSTTPRRHNSTTNAASSSALSSAAPNKYIVISRLKLDRVFLVDPEDKGGELTTFNNASKGSPSLSTKTGAVEVIDTGANIPDLDYVDRLLEVVEMGVAIHRFRFESKDDKKLWLRTLNTALNSVKPAFNINERQYLYKLLMTSEDLPPIVSALPENPTQLTSWPLTRFTASIASRQLLERLHSTAGHVINLHPSSTGLPAPASESEMSIIKQEVYTLKREHQRQLAESNARHEMDQLEIARLQKILKEKSTLAPSVSETPVKGKKVRERSATVDTNDSVGSAAKGGARKKAVAMAEARAEEYLHKYLDLLESSAAKEKREENMMRKLEAAETMMREQNAQFGDAMRQMSVSMDQSQREMAELRKQLTLQQQHTQMLMEQLVLANMRSEKPSIVSPSSGGTASSPSIPRTNSTASKPAVPNKPSTPISAVSGVLSPKTGSGSGSATQGPSWRGSAPAQVSTPDKSSYSAGGNSSGGTPGSAASSPLPVSAVPASVASRGKRPSSVNLIAVTPIESPSSTDGGVAVANSADSSESSASGGPGMVAGRPAPLSGTGASSPALFGTAGKSPSRLNLSTAVASGGATTATTGQNGAPVSPGGRGKERKLKNVRFPANGEESASKASWTSLARKKLGLSSTKTKGSKEDSPKEGVPWRQPPSSGTGTGSDSAGVQIKKPNKIDWSQTRAESYFSDDLGSDYDPNIHMSPSDFERLQDEQMAPDDGSDYSEEAAA